MATIKVYTDYSERWNKRFYTIFDIVNELPTLSDHYGNDGLKIVDVYEIGLDCEQGNDDVYSYDYYGIVKQSDDGDRYTEYVCIERMED